MVVIFLLEETNGYNAHARSKLATVYTATRLGVCNYQNMWYHDFSRLLFRKYHD